MLIQLPNFVLARGLQFVAALTAALTFLIVGTIATWPSPSYPKLKDSLESGVTSDQWAWVVSLLGIGGVITPIPAAYFTGRLGRKPVLLACAPFFLISWLLIIFASTAVELMVSRAIAGFGVGIVFGVCPVYVAEIAESKIRGILGTLMQLLLNIGSLLQFTVGPYVSYTVLAILSGIFPVFFLLLMSLMPESPRYYCMKSQWDKAEISLMKLRGATDAREVKEELEEMQKSIEEEMTKKGTPLDLIATKGTRRALLLMFGLIIIQQCGGIMAILSNAQEIFRTSGENALEPSVSAIIIGVIQLIASVITSFLVDRLGRRILLLISTVGCAISLLILGTFQYLSLKLGVDMSSWNWLPLMSLIIFLVSYCFGVGPLPIAYCGEIFPSNIRGLALSIASMTLSLTFIIVTKLYQVVADALGVYVTFWFFASVSLLGTIFIYFLVIETKGKSIESIVAELNHGESSKKPNVACSSSNGSPSIYSIKL